MPSRIYKRRCASFVLACSPPLGMALACASLAAFTPILLLKPVALLGACVLVLDGGARYREHVRLHDFLNFDKSEWINDGCPPRGEESIIRAASRSWCRRHAAIAAGIPKKEFYALGYRWWHVMPKGAPGVFFKKSFWKGVLGG